jgi:hypothetical protein
MRLRTQCPSCGLPFGARLEVGQAELPCPACGKARSVAAAGWSEERVERCPLCGSEHLYRQRDLNRALGCGLVVAGAALAPWTWGLSLVVLTLLDLWLYYRLRVAVVCYRCATVYRDARPTDRQTDFDLLKHDVLNYGKALEDRRTGKKAAPPPSWL